MQTIATEKLCTLDILSLRSRHVSRRSATAVSVFYKSDQTKDSSEIWKMQNKINMRMEKLCYVHFNCLIKIIARDNLAVAVF